MTRLKTEDSQPTFNLTELEIKQNLKLVAGEDLEAIKDKVAILQVVFPYLPVMFHLYRMALASYRELEKLPKAPENTRALLEKMESFAVARGVLAAGLAFGDRLLEACRVEQMVKAHRTPKKTVRKKTSKKATPRKKTKK